MKKKLLTLSFATIVAFGSFATFVPSESLAAESWDYGYNKTKKQWYNYYYHSSKTHWGSISKNGVTYLGPRALPKQTSKLNLDYNGPYAATYNKHVY